MKRVTKREYLKAKRIVDNYMMQQQLGKYQFLYWDRFEDEDSPSEKWITGFSLDDACVKFLQDKPEGDIRVDHEVMFQGNYYDITNQKGFENLI